MKKLFSKIFIVAILLSSVFSFAPQTLAATDSVLYFTSAQTNYSVGDNIYIKVRVNPNGEQINVVRAIFNFNTDVASFVDSTLDGAWNYPSPGSTVDGAAGSVNQGGFLLASAVTADSQFMTVQMKATAVGTLTFTPSTSSLLVDVNMVDQLNRSALAPYSVQIGPAAPVVQVCGATTTPTCPQPAPAPTCGTSTTPPCPPPTAVNHPPVFNDIGEKIGQIGTAIDFTVSATDPDGDHVSYSSTNLPAGANIDPQSGKFSWTPTVQGIYLVNFTATDDSPLGPLSASKTVRITVFCSGAALSGSVLSCPAGGDLAPLVCPVCQTAEQNFTKTSQYGSDITIFSTSHPVQEQWYPQNLVNLGWEGDNGALGFTISFDNNPNGELETSTFSITDKKITYRSVADGVWYFHLRAMYEDGWSKIYEYKVKIDTKAPTLIISDVSQTGGKAEIFFSGFDQGSGLDSYQYKIDNGDWAKTLSPLAVTELMRQGKVLSLRATDKAGNASEINFSLLTLLQEGDLRNYVMPLQSKVLLSAPHIDSLVTREMSGTIFQEQMLVFTGNAEPNSSVNLFLDDDPSMIASTTTDSVGRWHVSINRFLNVGTHKVAAVTVRDQQVSEKSNEVTFNLTDQMQPISRFPWVGFGVGFACAILVYVLKSSVAAFLNEFKRSHLEKLTKNKDASGSDKNNQK